MGPHLLRLPDDGAKDPDCFAAREGGRERKSGALRPLAHELQLVGHLLRTSCSCLRIRRCGRAVGGHQARLAEGRVLAQRGEHATALRELRPLPLCD